MVEKKTKCLSKSGETEEFKVLVPILKLAGNTLIAMVANKNSYLARCADFVLQTVIPHEHALTTWYYFQQQPKWSWRCSLLFVC